ncbi:hypothetical protein ABIB29_003421 [Arthrobacter sp. UYEF36]
MYRRRESSVPGAALLLTALGNYSYSDAIGAYLVAGEYWPGDHSQEPAEEPGNAQHLCSCPIASPRRKWRR